MNEFSHRRYPKCPGPQVNEVVYLYPGEYRFATAPTLIHTLLGSCVSVILYDPARRHGAMCHAVFSREPKSGKRVDCAKYMDCVLHEMIDRFAQYGTNPRSLKAKIFGGSRMLDHFNPSAAPNPGKANLEVAKKILADYKCQVMAEDIEGSEARRVFFCSYSGGVYLKRIRRLE